MKVKTTLFLFNLLISAALFAQTGAIHTVYFESGSSKLTQQEVERIKTILKVIPKEANFKLSGHTDADGSHEFNKALSLKRVKEVKLLLTSLGFLKDSVQTSALGETLPFASNSSDESKALNRRVEVIASWQNTTVDTSTIDQLFTLLDDGYQEFYIDPTKDTILRAERGTLVLIKSNSFNITRGCKKVKIRVKEVYDLDEMLINNLTTVSNSEVIETRGMLYVDAFCGNQKLKLNNGKSITNVMPITNGNLNLNYFGGYRGDSSSTINWIANNNGMMTNGNGIFCCCIAYFDYCPFFFCKIKRFLRIQSEPNINALTATNCADYNKLDYYGITSEHAFRIALLKYEVKNLEELLDTLSKIKEQELNVKLNKGEAGINEIQNFIFKQTSLGWANCDFYSKFPDNQLITLTTDVERNIQTKSFLVFTSKAVIIPDDFNGERGKFHAFKQMPKGESARIITLKYANGKAFISNKSFTIDSKTIVSTFKEVTIEELKDELERLN